MELPVNQRLKIFCKKERLKQFEVAHKVGALTNTISNMFTMRSAPSCSLLQGFALGFPYLDMNWVLRGEGSMYLNEHGGEENQDERIRHLEELLAERERVIEEKERMIQVLLNKE